MSMIEIEKKMDVNDSPILKEGYLSQSGQHSPWIYSMNSIYFFEIFVGFPNDL